MHIEREKSLSTGEALLGAPTFFDAHQAALRELFNILDLPPDAADSVGRAVEVTQPWVKGDHSRPQHTFVLDEERQQTRHGLYSELGLVQEKPLPPDHYDYLLVLGAIHYGNNRRAAFIRQAVDSGVTADRILLLGGQRPVYDERETDDIATSIQDIRQQAHGGKWFENVASGDTPLKWETDLIRLSAMANLGTLSLRRINLRFGNEDAIKSYEFEWRKMRLELTHTLAVARANGEPRHNTEACIADWLSTYTVPSGSKVAFVGANPHLERMSRAAHAQLRTLGRPDLQLAVAGPGAHGAVRESIYLGEVARSLYEDYRLLQSGRDLA